MNEILTKIPFDQIKNVEIYRNPIVDGKRKSLAQIVKETGAAYAINGTLYVLKTGKACCPLRSNGVTDCRTKETYYGYAWDSNAMDTFGMTVVPNEGYDNFIACTALIHPKLGKLGKLVYDMAVGGARGRTAMGVTGDGKLVLYVSSDKGGAKKTPEKLQAYLADQGCTSAIMLDGGGSSQGIFGPEKTKVTSTRKVPHCILVYLKKDGDKEETSEINEPETSTPDNPDVEEDREMLDLTKHVKSIIGIASKNDMPWDVGVDMFCANMVNAFNDNVPYYPGAEGEDWKALGAVWLSMSLVERNLAYNSFCAWYRKTLREEAKSNG